MPRLKSFLSFLRTSRLKRAARLLVPVAMGLLSLTLVTCDLFNIGLGAKVDLDPPLISISSPTDNAYLGGAIQVSGKVTDDIGLMSVSVDLVVDDAVVRSVPAVISGDTWTADIDSAIDDSNNPRVLDGSCVFVAKAHDTAGKTTNARVNINIDNHAPTVLVSVPQASETDEFNTRVIFRGTVYDPFPIQSVLVAVYNADGAELRRSNPVQNINWTIPIESADFNLSNGEYSYMIFATDKAGNTNSYLYHIEDMNDLFGKTVIEEDIGPVDQNEPGKTLPVTSAGSTLTAADLAAVRRYPPTETVHTNRALFVIDMNTDKPVFTVNVPSDSLALSNNVVGAGASVIGQVEDDDGIDKDSLVASFLPLDGTGTPLMTGGFSFPVLIADATRNKSAYSVNFPLREEGLASGLVIPDGLYQMILSVNDITGVASESNPIKFIIDGSVPIINDITPALDYIRTELPVTVRARVIDENGVASVMIGIDGFSLSEAYIESGGTAEDAYWSRQVSIPSNGAATVSIRLEATDTTGKTSTVVASYKVDEEPPALQIISPDLKTDASDLEYATVNGIIEILGASRDNSNNIASVAMLIGGVEYPADDLYAWTIELDTALFTDGDLTNGEVDANGEVPVTVTAYDGAGLSSTISRSLKIDQTTDIPVLTFGNVDPAATTEALGLSLNQMANFTTISATLMDDDGIAAGDIALSLNDIPLSSGYSVTGTAAARTLSVIIPTLAGSYKLTVDASDDASLKRGAPASSIQKTLWFAVDRSSPEIAFLSQSALEALNSYASGPFSLSLNLTDDLRLSEFTVTEALGTATAAEIFHLSEINAVNYVIDALSASDLQALPRYRDGETIVDGVYSYSITLKDAAGREAGLSRTLTLDTTAPVVLFTNVSPLVATNTVNGTISFKADVSEINGVDGVKWVVLAAEDAEPVWDNPELT